MPRKKMPSLHRVQTHQVTFRMPEVIHKKLEAIAISIFQPMPVVYRMALAEFVKNHRPAKHGNSGISLVWPSEVHTKIAATHVTEDDTPLSPREDET